MRTRSRSLTVATSVVLALVLSLVAAPAIAGSTASISGTVAVPAGHTVDEDAIYAVVTMLDEDSRPIFSSSRRVSWEDGTYTYSGLDAGTYRVLFFAGPTFASEWWHDSPTLGGATPITLAEGEARTGVDAELALGSTITGTVTYPAGTDVTEISTDVSLYRVDDPEDRVASAHAADDGTFTLDGFPPGSYKIKYENHDYSETGNVVVYQWQGGAFDFEGAHTITVAAPGATVEVTQTLMEGRTISGRISGAWFEATRDDYWMVSAEPNGYGFVRVEDDGTYTIRRNVPGVYFVHAFSRFGAGAGTASSAGEWWNDSVDQTGATPVDLTTSTAVTGVDMNVDTVGGLPARPVVSGTAVVGSTLTTTTGAWPAGLTLRYQWLANGARITDATSSTYKVTSAVLGKSITVNVWAQLAESHQEFKESAPTLKVPRTSVPTISGTAKVGATLTAKPGAWSTSTTFLYQWYANGVKISGATKATYTIPSSLMGKSLTVKVAGKKSGYTTVSLASKATLKVPRTAVPTISGTVKTGAKVTAKPGTWSTGTTFTYQWYASGRAIRGATKSTYVIPSSLRGRYLTVKVTGKKSGYTTVARLSAAKKVA
ncbi:hypothetical protein [Microbacterium sp. T2.11-28]|uniref:hypothetical protein n=1 Tax=Microbacterium sp. T2.11-28 TaxID=3041169 RepID=UPI0024773A4E|nr:hypothetical protein [Microbacterium sp. T2.11-28]CAI9391983.1 hypothetical protein MICABA_01959 [Microbacterium sp. T2.11-28]